MSIFFPQGLNLSCLVRNSMLSHLEVWHSFTLFHFSSITPIYKNLKYKH